MLQWFVNSAKFFLGLSFFLVSSGYSQSITQAKKNFKKRNYEEAIRLIELTLNDSVRFLNEDEYKIALYLIAESFNKSKNYENSLHWYRQLLTIDSSRLDPITYSRLLIKNGLYSECRTYIQQQKRKKPDPELEDLLIIAENGLDDSNYDSTHYVENVHHLNSPFSDFGAHMVMGKISLSSNRQNKPDMSELSNGHSLLDIYILSDSLNLTPLRGEINSTFNEGTLIYSEIHNMGFFTQCNGYAFQKTQCNIYTTIYDHETDTWSMGVLFDPINPKHNSGHPCISMDGNTLIFSSDMPGSSGGQDLWKVSYTEGRWSDPQNLGSNINTSKDELFPTLYNDSILFFASNGYTGFGGLDILQIPLDSPSLKATLLKPPINSYADDFSVLMLNTERGIFTSNRKGGVGDDDIYSFIKIKESKKDFGTPIKNLIVKGTVTEYQTGDLLPNSVVIVNSTYGDSDTLISDNNGEFILNELVYSEYLTLQFSTFNEGYLTSELDKFITEDQVFDQTDSQNVDTLEINISLIKIVKGEVKISRIFYDLDSWILKDESLTMLNKLYMILKANPDLVIEISSHTDARGSTDYNLELSEKRADAVVQYLINRGINENRLFAKGYGKSKPLVQAAISEFEHEINRRTSFRIVNYEQISNLNKKKFLKRYNLNN